MVNLENVYAGLINIKPTLKFSSYLNVPDLGDGDGKTFEFL
mgnify:CR=1 FL=1